MTALWCQIRTTLAHRLLSVCWTWLKMPAMGSFSMFERRQWASVQLEVAKAMVALRQQKTRDAGERAGFSCLVVIGGITTKTATPSKYR
jgi:hypothetical protein